MTYILVIAFSAIAWAVGMTIYAMLNATAAKRAEQTAHKLAAAAAYQKEQAATWRADSLTLRQRHGYNSGPEVNR